MFAKLVLNFLLAFGLPVVNHDAETNQNDDRDTDADEKENRYAENCEYLLHDVLY
jgi:hypothetical protein